MELMRNKFFEDSKKRIEELREIQREANELYLLLKSVYERNYESDELCAGWRLHDIMAQFGRGSDLIELFIEYFLEFKGEDENEK